jgi:hypothetical protein
MNGIHVWFGFAKLLVAFKPRKYIIKMYISATETVCNKLLCFFNDNWQIFKTNPEDLDIKDVIFKEDAKCCINGYKASADR